MNKQMNQNGTPNVGLIGKTMHFLFQNVYAFTVTIVGLVHAMMLLMMVILGVQPMIFLNILSVVVYIFCYILCNIGHIKPVFFSVFLEVTIYSILATHYIGTACGTCFLLLSVIPIVIYFGCHLFQDAMRWLVVAMLAVTFTIFIILQTAYSDAVPVFELSGVSRQILFIFSAFAMVFSVVFYNMIYIYASEVEYDNLAQINRQLSNVAQADALTSLLNRRGFLPMVESLMKDDRPRHFCIAFCDLDDFKRVNDSYGHDAGDEVLKHLTKLIMKDLNDCDICRWGGEEIVILMRDCDILTARERTERIRKRVESNPTMFYSHRISVTVTIGLEENKDKYKTADEIIKAADERMYYGKQHGKNVVIYEDPAE